MDRLAIYGCSGHSVFDVSIVSWLRNCSGTSINVINASRFYAFILGMYKTLPGFVFADLIRLSLFKSWTLTTTFAFVGFMFSYRDPKDK